MKRIGLVAVLLLCLALVSCGVQEITLQRIEVDAATLSDTFEQGSTVDISDAKLLLHYSNGEVDSIPLSSAQRQGNWNTAAVGPAYTIEFTYKGLRCTYSYAVVEKEKTQATAELMGGKREYEYGQTFVPQGTFVYDDETYDLQSLAAFIQSNTFSSTQVGENSATLVVECAVGLVELTYSYIVREQVDIDSAVYTGETVVLHIGDSAATVLAAINKAPFRIRNKEPDGSLEEVYAQSVTNYSTATQISQGICLATVYNKSQVAATVEVPYCVRKKYQPVTVTFDLNYEGGSTIELQTKDGLVSPPLTNRFGYKTPTWATAEGDAVDFSQPIERPTTFYAVWKKQTYYVTFIDGGNWENSKYEYNALQDVVLPIPEKEGCRFLSFSTQDGVPFAKTSWEAGEFQTDLVLVTNWDRNTYTINYNLQDTTAYPATNNIKNPASYQAYESVDLQDPSRNGYEFVRWAKDSKDGPSVERIDTIGNYDLYAVWEAHKLTIEKRVASDDETNNTLLGSTDFWVSETRAEVETPAAADYRFGGWYLDAACTQPLENAGNKYYLPLGIYIDITVYAKLTRVYTVYLDRNDGSGDVLTLTFAQGDENSATYGSLYSNKWKQASTRPACDCTAWQDQNGTTVATFDGTDLSLTTQQLAAYDKTTLYAQWTGHTHKITYVYGCVINGRESKEEDFSTLEPIYLPSDLVRTGYKFNGWTLGEDNASLQRIPDNTIEALAYDENLTVYAQWKKN